MVEMNATGSGMNPSRINGLKIIDSPSPPVGAKPALQGPARAPVF
jgi:hypothetical protein